MLLDVSLQRQVGLDLTGEAIVDQTRVGAQILLRGAIAVATHVEASFLEARNLDDKEKEIVV